jgi:hypothetical protein
LGYRNKDCLFFRSKCLLGQSKIICKNKLGERASIPEQTLATKLVLPSSPIDVAGRNKAITTQTLSPLIKAEIEHR